jgi:hypothetical protein
MDAKEVRALVAGIMPPIVEQIKKLNARIAELEKRPRMKYSGVYQSGRAYGEGEFVTHEGSMWHCSQQTNSKPGTDKT